MRQSLEATAEKLDPERTDYCFEIFGYDFMVTEDMRVLLIEVNTNPVLESEGDPVMQRIVPRMLDNAFRLAVDPVLPPQDLNFKKGQGIVRNDFRLIFD